MWRYAPTWQLGARRDKSGISPRRPGGIPLPDYDIARDVISFLGEARARHRRGGGRYAEPHRRFG